MSASLPTKIHTVKAMVFPVVMKGYKNWTIRKAKWGDLMLLTCGTEEDSCNLDCKEIKPVNHKGNKTWILIGRTDAETEAPILWPPHVKNKLFGKDWCWERLKSGGEGDERGWMVGWHHRLNGHEFDHGLGVAEEQGSLACCSPWGPKKSDITERLNWTEPLRWPKSCFEQVDLNTSLLAMNEWLCLLHYTSGIWRWFMQNGW